MRQKPIKKLEREKFNVREELFKATSSFMKDSPDLKQQLEQKNRQMDELTEAVVAAYVAIVKLMDTSKVGLSTYHMVMVVYGFWLFISGGALEFRPLKIGGAINWVLATFAFFVGFEQQLIVLAIAVLLGYIIPGHILNNKFKNVS